LVASTTNVEGLVNNNIFKPWRMVLC